MIPSQRLFGLTRDKLLLLLIWYSCLISVGLVYFAHERTEYNSMIRVIQRGIGDSVLATQQPWRGGWTRRVQVKFEHPPHLLPTSELIMPGKTGPTQRVQSTTQKMSEELQGYVHVIDSSPLQFHCGQCALVSSSGQLLNRGAGHDIDQSECIIRMNSAPVRTYEPDVGRRTTVRVIGHVNLGKGLHNDSYLQEELFGDPFERPELVIVPWLYSEKINKTASSTWNTALNLSKLFPEVDFYALTPEKMNLSEHIFQREVGLSRKEAHTWLSTGWMTMLFALDVCDKIDVYGLVEVDHCIKYPNDTALYHYFEPDFRQECDYYSASEGMLRYGHKFITEKAVFSKWSLQGRIFFHYPSWTAEASNSTFLDTPFLRAYREALLNGSLAALQSIPSKKKKVIRKKKIIRVIRRKKNKTIANTGLNKQTGGAMNALAKEETVLILNNSKDKGNIPQGRDPESVKKAELMRMARRKIIRSRRHKENEDR